LLENHGLYYAMWRQQIGERDVPHPEVTVLKVPTSIVDLEAS